MGEYETRSKGFMHGEVFAGQYLLVKPVLLRRLGPVNDGSGVHSSPGHSN
jgi:hypothetical protein